MKAILSVLLREEEENKLPKMTQLFFLYVISNLTRIAQLRKEDLEKHIGERVIQMGRLFFSSSLILMLLTPAFAQENSFVEYEEELSEYAFSMMDSVYDNRVVAAESFAKRLEEVLQMPGSYEYSFDKFKEVSVSVLPSEDEKFRIFTWQLRVSKERYIYGGVIQVAGQQPKVFALTDGSEAVRRPRSEVLDADEWYGALYYNIKPMSKRKNNKYYTVFGFDAHSLYTRRKVMDVLYFDKGEPKFGAPVFNIEEEGKLPRTDHRFILEYSVAARATLNYNEELKMIVYDHLIPFPSPYDEEGMAMMPDGSYHGFKLKRGKWNSVEKVFTHVQQNAPIVKPKLGTGRAKDPLLGNR